MAGLHQCTRCGWRWEDEASLEAHEPACSGEED